MVASYKSKYFPETQLRKLLGLMAITCRWIFWSRKCTKPNDICATPQ